jgi:uncharacterized protein DUF1552
MSRSPLGRRGFLGLLGGAIACGTSSSAPSGSPAPAAAPAASGGASAPPLRLLLVMQNNGTQQANFWPTTNFTSPILDPLLSNPAIASRTTVVRGIRIPMDANGTSGNEHDMGFARMFTGFPLMSVAGEPWGAGPSVDQIVASAWDTDSLALAVTASVVEPYPKPGFDHRRSFSYLAPGIHKIPTLNPIDAYARFFATGTGQSPDAVRAKLARRMSVLDANAAELRDLAARLGGVEKTKLDAHATAIRQLEAQLSTSLLQTACAAPAVPRDYRSAPDLLVSSDDAIPALVDAMSSLLAATLGCGAARVGSLQLGFSGGKWTFSWVGNTDQIHNCAHRDTSDAGSSAGNTRMIVNANRYVAGVVASIAGKLADTPELDGTTALDHTLIVWANEFGRGDHNQQNVPIVLIGGPLADSTGRGKLVDAGEQPFQRVGCTVLRSMGVPAEGFGDLATSGPIAGL